MIIFLYGSDAYRLKQAKSDIVDRYKAKHSSGVNLFYFDLSEVNDMNGLEDAIRSASFFNEHKLLVCKNSFSNKVAANTVAEFINKYGLGGIADVTFMAVENFNEKDLVSKHKDLFDILFNKGSVVKNIESLPEARLREWAQKEFEARRCSIELNALNSLLTIVGNDSWALINEIEKLCVYRSEGSITIADIKLLVVPTVDLNIFDLIDAIGARNNKKAFELLYCELKTGRDPYYILTMIIYQFRNLLMVKDLQKQKYSESAIAQKAKLHPFVIKKAFKSTFNSEEIIKIYGNLLAIDTGFKIGRISLEDSLYGFSLS